MLYHWRCAKKFSPADARRFRLRSLAWRIKDVVCRCGVFLAHEHLITASGEGDMGTSAAKRIRLDDSVDACPIQGALCKLRFPLLGKCLHDNKLGFTHVLNLTPEIEPYDGLPASPR